MLNRIKELIEREVSFSFETTLSAKSYQLLIRKAQEEGYSVSVLFFWLRNVNLAKERVATRVQEGGHNIPVNVIERRYKAGIYNLFKLYLPIVDKYMIFDNSDTEPELIAEKNQFENLLIKNQEKWQLLNQLK